MHSSGTGHGKSSSVQEGGQSFAFEAGNVHVHLERGEWVVAETRLVAFISAAVPPTASVSILIYRKPPQILADIASRDDVMSLQTKAEQPLAVATCNDISSLAFTNDRLAHFQRRVDTRYPLMVFRRLPHEL